MDSESVLALSDHTKALLKRFAFCRVGPPVVLAAIRASFEQSRMATAAASARTLFGGDNAIP